MIEDTADEDAFLWPSRVFGGIGLTLAIISCILTIVWSTRSFENNPQGVFSLIGWYLGGKKVVSVLNALIIRMLKLGLQIAKKRNSYVTHASHYSASKVCSKSERAWEKP